jgi:hypothetical protein
MNIKELKEIIKDLPDEMPVIPALYNDYGGASYDLDLSFEVETLIVDGFGTRKMVLEVALF